LDEEYASTRHLPVRGLKTGLMVLIALSIVTLIQVVGIILVIALLTIPVAVASELSMKFRTIMVLSIVVGIVSCASGLTFSYLFEIPSGAAIIMTGILILILLKGSKRLLRFGRKLPG